MTNSSNKKLQSMHLQFRSKRERFQDMAEDPNQSGFAGKDPGMLRASRHLTARISCSEILSSSAFAVQHGGSTPLFDVGRFHQDSASSKRDVAFCRHACNKHQSGAPRGSARLSKAQQGSVFQSPKAYTKLAPQPPHQSRMPGLHELSGQQIIQMELNSQKEFI